MEWKLGEKERDLSSLLIYEPSPLKSCNAQGGAAVMLKPISGQNVAAEQRYC